MVVRQFVSKVFWVQACTCSCCARLVKPARLHFARTARALTGRYILCERGVLSEFVGLQPTVIASRAPQLLLEQSVMTVGRKRMRFVQKVNGFSIGREKTRT